MREGFIHFLDYIEIEFITSVDAFLALGRALGKTLNGTDGGALSSDSSNKAFGRRKTVTKLDELQ